MPDRAFETKLNIYLSRIFNEELGIQSISETRRGKGRPDILIYVGGVKIVIEGSYSRKGRLTPSLISELRISSRMFIISSGISLRALATNPLS